MGLSRLVGVLGLGWREFGRFSGDLARSGRQSEEVFRLKTEKAGTDIGLSFLFLIRGSELFSSSILGSGLGVVGRGGEWADIGIVGTDMESERSPRDSNMSRTPSLTAEDCLL